jgi:hypothetical protein
VTKDIRSKTVPTADVECGADSVDAEIPVWVRVMPSLDNLSYGSRLSSYGSCGCGGNREMGDLCWFWGK